MVGPARRLRRLALRPLRSTWNLPVGSTDGGQAAALWPQSWRWHVLVGPKQHLEMPGRRRPGCPAGRSRAVHHALHRLGGDAQGRVPRQPAWTAPPPGARIIEQEQAVGEQMDRPRHTGDVGDKAIRLLVGSVVQADAQIRRGDGAHRVAVNWLAQTMFSRPPPNGGAEAAAVLPYPVGRRPGSCPG